MCFPEGMWLSLLRVLPTGRAAPNTDNAIFRCESEKGWATTADYKSASAEERLNSEKQLQMIEIVGTDS